MKMWTKALATAALIGAFAVPMQASAQWWGPGYGGPYYGPGYGYGPGWARGLSDWFGFGNLFGDFDFSVRGRGHGYGYGYGDYYGHPGYYRYYGYRPYYHHPAPWGPAQQPQSQDD